MNRSKYWHGDALMAIVQDGKSAREAAAICDDIAIWRNSNPAPYETKDAEGKEKIDPLLAAFLEEFATYMEASQKIIATVKSDYQAMKEIASSSSGGLDGAEIATLKQESERVVKKMTMATELLSKQEKALKEKEKELEELHERIDGLETRFNSGGVRLALGSVYTEPKKPTRKAGIDPFKIERDDIPRTPESVDYIDVEKIPVVDSAIRQGESGRSEAGSFPFPGSH
jgi:hypothetical protein